MVGTREVAYPRLNSFGYYTFLIGGLFLFTGLYTNTGPDTGWFAYVPLSGPEFAPGKRVDVWAQVVTFTEIAALVAAVEMIVTILKMRAPGCRSNRIPLYVWSILVVSFMIVFAMPSVAMASTMMLAMDRLVATHFFNRAEGGDPLLWQHLFWFFGHPEVYIMFIPGLGFVSSIVETFTGRKIFGYPVMVLSLVVTGFVAFGLWVHHMFATPIPQLGRTLFTAASVLIAVPDGGADLLLDRDHLVGRPRYTDGDAVRARLHRRVHHRRHDGGHDRLGAVRSPGARHVLHRRALPLRDPRRASCSPLWGLLLLVPEDHRPTDERDARQMALLAVLRRGERHLLSRCTCSGSTDAAACLHLPPRDGVGSLNLLATLGSWSSRRA
jgi:hypothetical protein